MFFFFRSHDSDSDFKDRYLSAEHVFPSAMGVPVETGLSQAEYKRQNDEYLKQAAQHLHEREPEVA
jgi:hypothetical protein